MTIYSFLTSTFGLHTPHECYNMEIADFVPVCGSMKRYRRKRSTYHKLKRGKEVSDCSSVENGCMLRPKVKMVEEEIPKAHHQPPTNKIRLSINLWKRLRNAYVQRMLGLAEHVAHLNNGEICFLKKIHDDEVQLLLAS
ncbi:hypothetical protein JHK85_026101 [Glycine max]|nr:hypothetical protein JHK85_026101 [Glycine max]